MAETVGGVFNSHPDAIHAVEELRREGFRPDQISIFVPDPRVVEGFGDEVGVRVVQASAAGLATGGLLGGIAGWLVGLSGLLIPGVGMVVAAGPVVGALAGALGGATVGGFVGMLVGLGLPEHAAEEYHRQLFEGRTLVFVHPEEEFGLAEVALNRANPCGIHHYDERIGAEIGPAAAAAATPASDGQSPTGRVEPAAPDRTLTPADVAEAIEGQQVMGHTQHLDAADLHPTSGSADTR
jgi:hypothetical protein